jgi:predicted DNA-binding transcriptional regulator AlpA
MQVLTYEQAAARASLNLRTLQRHMREGTGPSYIELGKRRRGILEADLEKWFLSRRVPAPGDMQ